MQEKLQEQIIQILKQKNMNKISELDLAELEKNAMETKIKSPKSDGIISTFGKGFLKNKETNFKRGNVYWVMNIITPTLNILNKNCHINIMLGEINGYYVGLHGSSDKKAFGKSIEIQVLENSNIPLSKPYYICMDRVYLFSKEWKDTLIVRDIEERTISNNVLMEIENEISNNDINIVISDLKKDEIFTEIKEIKVG